jgi:hypothetical protein
VRQAHSSQMAQSKFLHTILQFLTRPHSSAHRPHAFATDKDDRIRSDRQWSPKFQWRDVSPDKSGRGLRTRTQTAHPPGAVRGPPLPTIIPDSRSKCEDTPASGLQA